jgi:hypothetical protein
MRSFGQMRANDDGWPTFDGRYVGYPRFKKEWMAYRLTYHSAVSDDLAARTLRSKCLKGEALQMVSHLDDLQEIWETLDTCYERPGKYAEEALKPIVEFRRYKALDSTAVREFYSLVRAAIRGARKIGRIELLLNDQTIPQIMSKMPPFDWREWATKSSDWAGQDANLAFEDFIERKWLDAINIAATEPTAWKGEGEKAAGRAHAPVRAPGGDKGAMKLTGAVNTIERGEPPRSPSPQWSFSFRKKCRARNLIGCDGSHVILKCEKLHGMKLAERREVVEKSGLCTFCLRHGAELECYAKGGLSKPRCARLGCDGEHATWLHALLGEADAVVNLVSGGDGEAVDDHEGEYDHQYGWEEEGSWVNTLGAAEAAGEPDEVAYSDQDMAPCPSLIEEEGGVEEWEYEGLWVGTIGAVEVPREASRIDDVTASQGLSQEDDQGKAEGETTEEESEQWSLEAGQSSGATSMLRNPEHRPIRRLGGDQARRPIPKASNQSGPGTRSGTTVDQQWEEARRNAWLRQLLSDDSSDESDEEERYGRFAESGRWMSELYGIPQCPTATLGRECSA